MAEAAHPVKDPVSALAVVMGPTDLLLSRPDQAPAFLLVGMVISVAYSTFSDTK